MDSCCGSVEGTPTVVAAPRREQPLAWNPDGESIWVLNRDTRPAKIFHVGHEERTPQPLAGGSIL
jgi:hypothetical protein